MARFVRIVTTFAILQVAYWTYCVLAVPWIEPWADPGGVVDGGPQPTDKGQQLELAKLFKPGDWELDDPKILESDEIKLLLRDYANLGGGKMELRPCTVIFTPHGAAAGITSRIEEAIVLQAPQGAVLEFDRPFDLRSRGIGRLVAGHLMGPIIIRSDGRLPGPEDDLRIHTSDVEMNEERVWTPHEVEFVMGRNFGRGEQMQLKFLPGDRKGTGGQTLNIGGFDSFELRRLERLHVQFAANGAAPGAGGRPGQNAPGGPGMPGMPAPASSAEQETPVEVTCRGPMRYDFGQQLATFQDHVDVQQLNATGPSNQINCEWLGLYFVQRRDANAPKAGSGQSVEQHGRTSLGDLQPRRIEARGEPVRVHAPSQQLSARCERLEYDIATRRIVLESAQESYLQQGTNVIRAKTLDYQPREGGLGQAMATGPGQLSAEMNNRPGQVLTAQWKEQLRIRPFEQQHVISLTGGAKLGFGSFGELNASEIYFWLNEIPTGRPGEQPRVEPDRMLARRQVTIQSTQISGEVDQMEVWFEPAPMDPVGAAMVSAGAIPGQAMRSAVGGFPGAALLAGQPPRNSPANLASFTGSIDNHASPQPQQGRQGPPGNPSRDA